MLKSLKLHDWKSFGQRGNEFPLAPLTLLVGPNASGKSNVFDALRLLQGLALDLSLDDALRGRWEGGREVWQGIRGGSAEAARKTTLGFALTSTWSDLTHTIEVETDTHQGLGIQGEELSDPDDQVFSTHRRTLGDTFGRDEGGALRVAVRKEPGSGRWPSRLLRDSRSVLGQLRPSDDFAPTVMDRVEAMRTRLRELIFLDIQPRLMRGPSQPGRAIGLSGEHVAAAIHALSERTRQDVVDWLSELCDPKLQNLQTELIPDVQDVYLFAEEAGGVRVSARSLSDGTLRFLGTVVALLTAPPGSVVLLEEPDVGLHPARVHLLAEFLEMVTRPSGIQVIATTHSPVLLAHLSEETFLDAVAFARAEEGWTEARRIGGLPQIERLKDPGKRVQLISTGWLERAA